MAINREMRKKRKNHRLGLAARRESPCLNQDNQSHLPEDQSRPREIQSRLPEEPVTGADPKGEKRGEDHQTEGDRQIEEDPEKEMNPKRKVGIDRARKEGLERSFKET